MLFLTRGRWRTATTAVAAGALAATTLAFAGSPAQAAEDPPAPVTAGTLSWGLSTYLGSSTMGRPNPLGSAYISPASFDDDAKIATWANATGELGQDGHVNVNFSGASVNFSKTGGAWLRLADPQVVVDAEGNGALTAEVAYGTAPGTYPNISYDAAQEPLRPIERVEVAVLEGNTSDDVTNSGGRATFAGLDGKWSDDFIDYLDGDAGANPSVEPFIYVGQIDNETADRTFLPLSFSVVTSPAVSATATANGNKIKVAVSATNVNPDSEAQFVVDGVYLNFGVKQNVFTESEGQEDGMEKYIASKHVGGAEITDGAFAHTFTVPKKKLAKGQTYAIYTWTAHGNPKRTDSQYTETIVKVPGLPKNNSKTVINLKKKPTTKKKGKAVVKVKGVAGVKASGKVRVVLKKGKQTKKTTVKLNKKGKAAVKLGKLKKGKWKIVAKYKADKNFKKSKKAVKFKVKK